MFQKLKNHRTKNNLKLIDMSTALNISNPFYMLMEKGKRAISYEMAVKIAKTLNSKPDALLLEDQIKILNEMK